MRMMDKMDSFEIVSAILKGATLEVYQTTKDENTAAAYVDELPVSISQAMRAINNPLVKQSAKSSNWSAYVAA